jgi:hypothetical protein
VLALALLKSGWIIDVMMLDDCLCLSKFRCVSWLLMFILVQIGCLCILMAALSHVFFGDAPDKIRLPELSACPFSPLMDFK